MPAPGQYTRAGHAFDPRHLSSKRAPRRRSRRGRCLGGPRGDVVGSRLQSPPASARRRRGRPPVRGLEAPRRARALRRPPARRPRLRAHSRALLRTLPAALGGLPVIWPSAWAAPIGRVVSSFAWWGAPRVARRDGQGASPGAGSARRGVRRWRLLARGVRRVGEARCRRHRARCGRAGPRGAARRARRALGSALRPRGLHEAERRGDGRRRHGGVCPGGTEELPAGSPGCRRNRSSLGRRAGDRELGGLGLARARGHRAAPSPSPARPPARGAVSVLSPVPRPRGVLRAVGRGPR